MFKSLFIDKIRIILVNHVHFPFALEKEQNFEIKRYLNADDTLYLGFILIVQSKNFRFCAPQDSPDS